MRMISTAGALLKKEILIQRIDKRKALGLFLLVVPITLLAMRQGGGGLVPAPVVLPLAPILFSQLLTSLFAGDDLQVEQEERMLEVIVSAGVDLRLMLACKSVVTALLPIIAGCVMAVSANLLTAASVELPAAIASGACYFLLLICMNATTALLSVLASAISTDTTFLNLMRVLSPFVLFAPLAAAAYYLDVFGHTPALLATSMVGLAFAAALLFLLPQRFTVLINLRSSKSRPSLRSPDR